MTGSLLRRVAQAQRVPLLGRTVRDASMTLMGLAPLRQARLGDVKPYSAEAQAVDPAEGT